MAVEGDGVALSRSYFLDVVAPLLHRSAPEVRFAAARVGTGSEVLGFDDTRSRDHDWGLRLQLFVPDADRSRVESVLDTDLPAEYRGHPVRLELSGDRSRRSGIDVTTVAAFAGEHLGFDPRGTTSAVEWLSLTGQSALEVTAGAVFEDRTGELTGLRRALTWYPDDLWRYVVACDWHRLDQELPLLGRAGERGDELGSRVITARLVDIAVHLAFLVSRVWPPYAKWRGSAFARLPGCASVAGDLGAALDSPRWADRQATLGDALTGLARLQRQQGLPAPRTAVEPFWDRPHLHLDRRLLPALLESIVSPEIAALPAGVGSVEQQTDNVAILTRPDRRRRLAASLRPRGRMTP